MSKKRGTALLPDMRHVSDLMRKAHAGMDRESLADIGPHELASRVLAHLDPQKQAPFDVRLCARATLVHMAAALCANVHRTAEETCTAQGILFNAGLHTWLASAGSLRAGHWCQQCTFAAQRRTTGRFMRWPSREADGVSQKRIPVRLIDFAGAVHAVMNGTARPSVRTSSGCD